MQSIQRIANPDLQTVQSVRALERVCRDYDHLEGSLFLDPSLNLSSDMPCLITVSEDGVLVGAMTFFAPTAEEAELVGLTHPEYRRSGVFRAMVEEAAQQADLFQIPSLLFVSEPQSSAGVAAVLALGAELEYTEFSLHFDPARHAQRLSVPADLSLHRATKADLPDLAAISAACFHESEEHALQFIQKAMASEHRTQYFARLNGEPVGIGCIGLEDGEATIYGLGVRPRLQGRGIGRGIIALMLESLFANGTHQILIEVDSSNANALHLYLSCGFVQEATYDYYRAPTKRFLG